MERLVDVIPVVLSVAVGALTVGRGLSGQQLTIVPLGAWVGLLAFFVMSLALVTIWVEHLDERAAHGVFVGSWLSGMALVLTAPSAGWMATIVIYTALVSGYLLSTGWSIAVIALNTAAIAGGVALNAATFPQDLWISVVSASIYVLLQVSAVMFVWLYQRQTELRTSLEVANISLHATRELLAASTRSGERTRIARDLHDVLGHQLTALALELEVAAHTADPGTAQHIKRAQRTAKSMLTEVRATVGALRDCGESVQEALLRITNGVTAPQIDLTVDASSIRSPEVRTAVVLGVQEIVTNAIRHAKARTLRIDVRTESGSMIVIDASDDGIARDPILAGNGLTGMRERFESLGGSVHFSVAGGFRITAMVPA